MTTTHRSTPMPWGPALAAWLAAARAPQARAPALVEGILDGAPGPDDLIARGEAFQASYLEKEKAQAAELGVDVLWGASAPRRRNGDIVWGRGDSRAVLRPGPGGWVVVIEADVRPHNCAALDRADAARGAGANWAWMRADVRPAARAARERLRGLLGAWAATVTPGGHEPQGWVVQEPHHLAWWTPEGTWIRVPVPVHLRAALADLPA